MFLTQKLFVHCRFRLTSVRETACPGLFSYSFVSHSPFNPALDTRPFTSSESTSSSSASDKAAADSKHSTSTATASSNSSSEKAAEALELCGVSRQTVTHDICTFVFKPVDPRAKLPAHVPGQYGVLALHVGGKHVVRNFTITSVSNSNNNTIAISAKRTKNGFASKWLHEAKEFGASVRVRLLAIQGEFSCFRGVSSSDDKEKDGEDVDMKDATVRERPLRLLFVSGGVGITPTVAMLRGLRALQTSKDKPGFEFKDGQQRSSVAVTLIHSCQTLDDVPASWFSEFQSLKSQSSSLSVSLSTVLCVTGNSSSGTSNPRIEGVDKLLFGRITQHASTLKQLLQPSPADVDDAFVCGPAGFMTAATDLLLSLGVRNDNRIHTESFAF